MAKGLVSSKGDQVSLCHSSLLFLQRIGHLKVACT